MIANELARRGSIRAIGAARRPGNGLFARGVWPGFPTKTSQNQLSHPVIPPHSDSERRAEDKNDTLSTVRRCCRAKLMGRDHGRTTSLAILP
jgi:hypothetical protein